MAPLNFAFWVPNVSRGLVNSKVPQRTSHDLDYNIKLAQIAEEKGFTFALTQIRFMSAHDGDEQYESVSYSHALLAQTKKLNVIAAILPGPWHPALTAKTFASIDHYTGGRISINVVSGWYKQEQAAMGLEWPEHDGRYVRSTEFIRSIRGLWNEPSFSLDGQFYKFDNYSMEPKPSIRVSTSSPSTNHGTLHSSKAPTEGTRGPIIFMGGNSAAARRMAGTEADWFFLNGNDDETFTKWILDVRANAQAAGRRIKVGIHGFVIAKPTTEEAYLQLNHIVNGANPEQVSQLYEAFKEAGKSAPEGEGMWAKANFKDLVQYNEGFRTGLIGSYDDVARRIIQLKSLGADLVLTAYLHFQDELAEFGDKVIPLVRQYEQEAIDSGEAKSWPTFENYPVPEDVAAKWAHKKVSGTVDHIAVAEQLASKKRANGEANGDSNGDANGHGDAKRIKV